MDYCVRWDSSISSKILLLSASRCNTIKRFLIRTTPSVNHSPSLRDMGVITKAPSLKAQAPLWFSVPHKNVAVESRSIFTIFSGNHLLSLLHTTEVAIRLPAFKGEQKECQVLSFISTIWFYSILSAAMRDTNSLPEGFSLPSICVSSQRSPRTPVYRHVPQGSNNCDCRCAWLWVIWKRVGLWWVSATPKENSLREYTHKLLIILVRPG